MPVPAVIIKGLETTELILRGYGGVAVASGNTYGVGTYGVATYGNSLPPVISNIVVTLLSPTSVQIQWTTDVQSDTQVQYGLQPSYGQVSPLDSTPTLTHRVILNALQPGTAYHFQALSTGIVSGQRGSSSDQIFVTPALSLSTLTNFKVLSIGPQQVTVTWDTSLQADSLVSYGLTNVYGQQTNLDAAAKQSHLVTITGLLPNTTYHLQAQSHDSGGVLLLSNDLVITTPLPAGRIYTWIEHNGTAHVLDPTVDQTLRVIQGAKGHGHPPTIFIEDHVPAHSGAIVRDVLHDSRELEVMVLVQTADYVSLITKVRQMRQWMNQINGDGTLQIADPDGAVRQYTCRLKSGLEGEESQDTSGPTWRKLLLVFRTTGNDPYAHWPSSLDQVYQQASASATWFPIFPLVLGGVGIFAQPTVNNPGDLEAEPIWTLVGPMTNPTLTNTTTGAKVSMTTSLLASQTLTIDTRFRVKTVTRNDGTNLFSSLSNDSSLWTLAPGNNVVSVTAGGTTSASQIKLSFTPRTL